MRAREVPALRELRELREVPALRELHERRKAELLGEAVEARFARARKRLAQLGLVGLSPLYVQPRSHEGPRPPGYGSESPHSSACHMHPDLSMLLECDALYLLPDAHTSRGAMAELIVARSIGLPILYSQGKYSPTSLGTWGEKELQ